MGISYCQATLTKENEITIFCQNCNQTQSACNCNSLPLTNIKQPIPCRTHTPFSYKQKMAVQNNIYAFISNAFKLGALNALYYLQESYISIINPYTHKIMRSTAQMQSITETKAFLMAAEYLLLKAI